MDKQARFSGVIAPVLTPFAEGGDPDPERFVAHCQWLMAEGCTALAPFGTTSEGNSLGRDERMQLLEEVADCGIAPEKLMPGTGACALSEAVVLSRHAVELGCGGVLMLPPFYYKAPSEEGLFRFFADVIDGVGDDRLRVYLYHIPRVAQVGFSLPLIGRLIKAFPDTVVGLKDSSGDWSNTAAILAAHPGFEVFPGSEEFLLQGLRKGAAGCISATCNVSAAAIRQVYDNWQGPEADALQAAITALRKAIEAFPMIAALKALIAHYRRDPGWANMRPPFTPLPDAEAERAIATLAEAHKFRLDFAKAA
jgi:4-hydroxy-tetrahydrodipicolinate synthase